MVKKKKTFDEFYEEQWQERWPELKEALQVESPKLARLCQLKKDFHLNDFQKFALQKIQWDFPFDFYLLDKSQSSSVSSEVEKLLEFFYWMDLASAFPVLALDLQKNDRVLDMCSAPGGKALMMAELKKTGKEIVLNDSSLARLKRLRRVLQEYLTENVFAEFRVMHGDGRFLHQKELAPFDKILLDAPCSSERHVLQDSKELKKWTPSRSRLLAKRQYQLLKAAWNLLKVGGRLVYSTCSISYLENDLVIEKFLDRKNIHAQVISQDWPLGELTQCAWQILPSHQTKKLGGNWGPMYICILEKLSYFP